jgi:hypothetical protein
MAEKLTITKGADKQFFVRLTDAEGDIFSISGATEVVLLLPKSEDEGGGALQKKLSDADGSVEVLNGGTCGKIKFRLTEIETAQLAEGEDQSFEVEVTITDYTHIVQFLEKLDIVDRVFS